MTRARGSHKRGGGVPKVSVEQTAEVLKVSPDTVLRDWRLAKARLAREMGKTGASGNDA
jgi:DNA-directed RNA polymerase specialized sigma24 family protein